MVMLIARPKFSKSYTYIGKPKDLLNRKDLVYA